MATASLRYEASSPDGSQFLSGISSVHRASSSMDRSASYRDNYDSRGAVSPPACDSTALSGVLSLEPIPLAFGRQPDVKRMPNSAPASVEEAAQIRPLDTLGAEELKRVITDSSRRARDRARHLGEAVQKLDRFTKKRCRPEPSSERANGGTPAERPPERSVQVKAGSSSSADAKKGLVPSKRLRTSIAADARDGGRPTNSNIKKSMDRESPRPPSMLPSPSEEKVRTPSENWDKTKLKGRRSGIKSEAATPAVVNGTLEQDREHKWATQQHRMSQETRVRPSEAHGLRSGPVHGVTSVHKGEASLQMNGSTLRAVTKGECDSTGADRLPKNGLKPPIQDDLQPVNPAGPTKTKAARAPRSSTVGSINPSHCARVSSFTDREKAQGITKVQQPSSTQGNRKRPAPSRSSSPVAQWVGQRPQKMARVARRVNLLPGGALPSTDVTNGTVAEPIPERDPAAAVTVVGVRSAISNSSATGVSRRVSAHSPTQGKPRNERAVALSESGESEEVGDSKLKDKGRRQAEWDSRATATNQKAGSLVLPPKVVQPLAKDEIGDGVRRQGRSGRNFSAAKPSAATTEKVTVSSSNAKQLRSARVEKPDRPGRTPPKKATGERKAITRIRRPSDAGLSLLSPGDSDDDHEELANAVRAAVDASAHACPNKFWKEMEPYFAFVTSDDLCYLRQLAELKLSSDTVSSTPSTDGVERTPRLSDANLESEMSPDPLEVRTGGRIGGGGGWFDKIYPLSQRLLAALINEGDDEDPSSSDCDTKYRDTEPSQRQADGGSYANGHQNLLSWDDAEVSDIMADGRQESASLLKQMSGTCDSNLITANSRTRTGWESQYEQMSLDDRILLELQSIGLVVEQVPDLSQRDEDEVCLAICKLQDELKDQASINKERVETLEKAVLSRREEETRDRERLALSKLIESAYAKRKGCRGSSAAGAKGSGTKAARAAALAFSKRAIARLRQFESGQSCFVDPALRDILLCSGTKQSEATAEPVPDGEVSITPALTEVVVPRHGAGKSAPRSRTEKPDSDHPRPGSSWSFQKDTQEDCTQSAPVVRNAAGFGGAKGKRSERDGKGHGKESHRKQDNDRVPRQATSTLKGERKVKTKPRQKTASLFKDVNGLLGNPTGEASRQRPSALVPAAPRSQEPPPAPVLSAPAAEPMDLALVGIPGVLGDHDEAQDLGAWLDFTDNNLDTQGDLIGLDVPMDDLSDLGMMM